jgi:hypothetical protein
MTHSQQNAAAQLRSISNVATSTHDAPRGECLDVPEWWRESLARFDEVEAGRRGEPEAER